MKAAICTYHSNRETNLACSRCDRPICTECVVHSPVGMRCPECWYMRRDGIKRRAYGDKTVLKGFIILLIVGLSPLALLIFASITGGARHDIPGFLASSEPIRTSSPAANVVDDTTTPSATLPPAPTETHTAIPSPSPVPRALLKHLSEKLFVVNLINQERKKSGAPPVQPGDNVAAQLHAESALANCFASHWGLDGLKPYMRYSLAGGYQSNVENGSGSDYCITESDGYTEIRSVQQRLARMMDGLMSSSDHRRNILNERHRKVNIGLAWDRYNIHMYQHFEGDYVEYDQLPSIEDKRLTFSGRVKNGVSFDDKEDLGVQIYYDPPPGELTRGQVSRTYCYDSGLPIAALRPPPNPGWRYRQHTFSRSYSTCPDPYEVPEDAPPPASPDEATEFWGEAYYASQYRIERATTGPWITSSTWTARDTSFSVSADIRKVLYEHGIGIYTVVVWGSVDGETAVISQYAMFYEVVPPDIRLSPMPTRTAVPPQSPGTAEVPSVSVSISTNLAITPTSMGSPTLASIDTPTAPQAPTATTTPVPSPTASSTPSPTPAPTSTPTPLPPGASRENPIPVGEPGMTADDFRVWVVEVRKDAHDIIAQANEDKSYYEQPLPGHVYIMARIKVRNLSPEPQSLSNNRWSVVGSTDLEFGQCRTGGGGFYYSYEVPDEYDDDRLMFQDGEIEGNLCFTVKSSDLDSLVMFDSSGGNWVFFALQ